MIRVGIIGLGFMGQTHLRCYQQLSDQATVVAISDLDPRRVAGDFRGTSTNLEGAAGSPLDMNVVYGTTDYLDLIARPDIDLVDVCAPTPGHPEIVKAAAKAGKHVLCEKPFAITGDAADEMLAAIESADGYVMPAMCMRFWPQWRWLRDAIHDGRYGRVLSAHFTRLSSPPPGWYRDAAISGGAAKDLHIHDTDFIRYCFGEPRGVMSRGWVSETGGVDHIVTHYLFDSVPVVVAEGSWAVKDGFGFRMRFTVNFEHATVDFDLARSEPLLVHRNGSTEAIDCGSTDGWFEEIRYFLTCIANGTPPSVVTSADAVKSIRLIEAEIRSVTERRLIELS